MAEDHEALEALRVSWRLAPANTILAETRVNLAGLLSEPDLKVITLSESDLASVINDFQTLSRFDQAALEYYRSTLPHLKNLVPTT